MQPLYIPLLNISLRLGIGDFCSSSCLPPGEAPADEGPLT